MRTFVSASIGILLGSFIMVAVILSTVKNSEVPTGSIPATFPTSATQSNVTQTTHYQPYGTP